MSDSEENQEEAIEEKKVLGKYESKDLDPNSADI